MSLAHLLERNIALIRLLVKLRDHLDVHRLISLNATALVEPAIPETFIAYSQGCALEGIALMLSKIFESPKRHELNSVRGNLRLIKSSGCEAQDPDKISEFCCKYGTWDSELALQDNLEQVIAEFASRYEEPLSRLKTFRDKIGAHSEAGIDIQYLPSHHDFEKLYEFAFSFYSAIAAGYLETVPATVHPRVAMSFARWVKRQLGNSIETKFPEE